MFTDLKRLNVSEESLNRAVSLVVLLIILAVYAYAIYKTATEEERNRETLYFNRDRWHDSDIEDR